RLKVPAQRRRHCWSITAIFLLSWGISTRRLCNGRKRWVCRSRLARILINYPEKLMRSNILIRAAVWCLGLGFLLSCVSKKPVIIPGGGETRLSGGAKAALLDRVDRQQKSYTTISGRARCNLTVNDKD